MADFTIKSDSVNVEQIMERIRERIREKRGVDYTEAEVKTLASVKLEKFLDPGVVRSDLLEYYRKNRPLVQAPVEPCLVPAPPIFGFEEDTIYVSSRGIAGRTIAWARRVLNPLLKLFFNPNPLIHVLHLQADINRYLLAPDGPVAKLDEVRQRVNERERVRGDLDLLHFEVLNNLVVETTRMSIEVRNMKMRLESLATRLDFDERRARALEGVVQYRTGASLPRAAGAQPAPPVEAAAAEEATGRRKRRRRGRRRAGGPGAGPGTTDGGESAAESETPPASASEPGQADPQES